MTIEECRTFYAQEVRFAAGLTTPGLAEAFAKVPREKFLGPGPWQIGSADARAMSVAGLVQMAYITVEDPRDVYHNAVIALDRARDINNGQPGSLGRWIDALSLKPGACVYHLGCGVGYYTAIMAEVVGSNGRVVGLELQPDLAARAKKNLADYANATIAAGDGAAFDPGECDAIFVNCGVTHPQRKWLERLRQNGRLLAPFTTAVNATIGQGVMMKIIRSDGRYATELVSTVGIYSGQSLRDAALEPQLLKGLTTGGLLKVKSVRLGAHDTGETCVVHGREACLSLAEAT